MGQTLRMGTLKEWVSLCFVTESFIYYLSGERTHVQRHAPSRLPCGLGFYDNGSRPRPLLSQATANWNRVMGSYVNVDPRVATDSEEVESDSKKHCEFEVIITP